MYSEQSRHGCAIIYVSLADIECLDRFCVGAHPKQCVPTFSVDHKGFFSHAGNHLLLDLFPVKAHWHEFMQCVPSNNRQTSYPYKPKF